MDNKRFYSFTLVIYEDDPMFKNQFENLQSLNENLYIRHDNDVNEETGEPKKPHYHYVLRLKSACTISALSKRIEVPEHMIEPVKKSFNGSLKYLIHYGLENKYQYEVDEVKGNSERLKRKFEYLVNTETPEVEKVMSIQTYIESYYGPLTMAMLGRYVQKINQWDAFRRNMTYFSKILDEHNIGYRMY